MVNVFAVPGHTAGSAMCLVGGVLHFGDAATGAADGQVRAPPWLFSDDVDEGQGARPLSPTVGDIGRRRAGRLGVASVTPAPLAEASPRPEVRPASH